MSSAPRWSYVQARLQARNGDLLTDLDWHALESAKSIEHFIDRTRATSLRRYTAPLNAAMTSHAVERLLRQAWRAYVAEIADWVPADWRAAVLWVAVLADLPAVDALLKGAGAAWIAQDPVLADLADADRRAAAFTKSQLAPLLPAESREAKIGARWSMHWRALWPAGTRDKGLDRFVATVATHYDLLARASERQSSAPYRRDLAQKLTRLFRRHGASPVAVFAHLALVALELERLRGNLVRRLLFGTMQEAA